MVRDFIQVKDLKPGMVILHRGRRLVVKELIFHPETALMELIDEDGEYHVFHPDEWIGYEGWATREAGIRLSSPRFARLLETARTWDRRHRAACHAQQDWMVESFVFGEAFCQFVDPQRQREWDNPKTANGHSFTKCG